MSNIGRTLTPNYKEVLHMIPATPKMAAFIWDYDSDIDSGELVKIDFIACVKFFNSEELYFLPFVWNPEMCQFTDLDEYMKTVINVDGSQYEVIKSEDELSELLNNIHHGMKARKEREANGDR